MATQGVNAQQTSEWSIMKRMVYSTTSNRSVRAINLKIQTGMDGMYPLNGWCVVVDNLAPSCRANVAFSFG